MIFKKRFQNKRNVAVLFGGMGAEHEISKLSAEYVISKIDTESYHVLPILINKDGCWYLKRGRKSVPVSPFVKNGIGGILEGRRFTELDAAFPVLHGDFGEDGRVQGLLECLNIPFVGCKTLAGAISSDKSYTKCAVCKENIPTLPWLSTDGRANNEFLDICESSLGFPLFIKPAGLGSSVGAGVAHCRRELSERVRIAAELGDGRAVAERYLKNPRELECAFIDFGGKTVITPPGEIHTTRGFYDFSGKYSADSAAFVSPVANIDEKIRELAMSYAERIIKLLGVRGLARVDFFLSDGEIYFNEINTMPGMTVTSLYPTMLSEAGIAPEEFINGLIGDAIRGVR